MSHKKEYLTPVMILGLVTPEMHQAGKEWINEHMGHRGGSMNCMYVRREGTTYTFHMAQRDATNHFIRDYEGNVQMREYNLFDCYDCPIPDEFWEHAYRSS